MKCSATLTTPGAAFHRRQRCGKGGRGNQRFATSTHQTPRHAERGEPGYECDVHLELKLIADAGLIGLPNARGKSIAMLSMIRRGPAEDQRCIRSRPSSRNWASSIRAITARSSSPTCPG